jgi:hypothetical protein
MLLAHKIALEAPRGAQATEQSIAGDRGGRCGLPSQQIGALP